MVACGPALRKPHPLAAHSVVASLPIAATAATGQLPRRAVTSSSSSSSPVHHARTSSTEDNLTAAAAAAVPDASPNASATDYASRCL
ncbi:hypothetical protein HYH02_002075 [Chlamydomonas schloesseri]|uniref:Uncharacterized protein n=1 Tax=Chlamydomonas schloesseri TaxID=2026947 RepID=A0A835WTE1_9CHLO|nr:hypothetical protein HYH02_002075 [Chlamydomonas schloesseri]|eukprot:KAG2453868.1 hypothetical protein HYH02_002075 [Chlamydomonas schloesseri]